MVEDTEEARLLVDKYPRPLNVIEGPLMKVSHGFYLQPAISNSFHKTTRTDKDIEY